MTEKKRNSQQNAEKKVTNIFTSFVTVYLDLKPTKLRFSSDKKHNVKGSSILILTIYTLNLFSVLLEILSSL